jgi:putative hydrolase of the HAD superfamily
MPKKAIIYDLDNTVYPAHSIGDKLFAPIFDLIANSGQHNDTIEHIKQEMMRTPFRLVAQHHKLSDELTAQAVALQEEITYDEAIATFEDYPETKSIPGERFLVTTGFEKMQWSKIRQMGIENDFKEIHIVNPVLSSKKEVFADIMKRNNLNPADMLVVGDDPLSEIKAAHELGIDTVLYDKNGFHDPKSATYHITHFKDLKPIYLNG